MNAEIAMTSPAVIKPLTPAQELAAVWMFVKRHFLLSSHFKASFVAALLNTMTPLVIYGMIAFLGSADPALQRLTGGYVNFMISGIIVNLLLSAALAGPYRGLMQAFWNDRIEILLVSPLRLPVFVTGISVGGFVSALMQVAIYLAAAFVFLDFHISAGAGALQVLVILVPALVACTGLGLAAASTVYLLDARGGQDPVRFLVEMVSGLLAGVYFPLQNLPLWAQWVGHLVPHTYAIDGIRRALFGDASLPPLPIHALVSLPAIATDLVILTIYALIAFPIGWKMFQKGMSLARTDGRLSRWQ